MGEFKKIGEYLGVEIFTDGKSYIADLWDYTANDNIAIDTFDFQEVKLIIKAAVADAAIKAVELLEKEFDIKLEQHPEEFVDKIKWALLDKIKEVL